MAEVASMIAEEKANPKLTKWVDYCAEVTDRDVRTFRESVLQKFKNDPGIRRYPIKQFPQDPSQIPRTEEHKSMVTTQYEVWKGPAFTPQPGTINQFGVPFVPNALPVAPAKVA